MKAIFLSALALGMCGNPDLDMLEKKVEQLTLEQVKTEARLDLLKDLLMGKNEESIERAKISSVKANMHTYQTMLETYAVDWGGTYPQNVTELIEEAKEQNYYREVKNPYSGLPGVEGSIKDGLAEAGCEDGMTYYQTPATVTLEEDSNSKYPTYELSGCAADQQPITDHGHPFILSNF